MTGPGHTNKHCIQKGNIKSTIQSHEQKIDVYFPQNLIFFDLSYPQTVRRSLPHTMASMPTTG